ncbi:ENTH-domain-containing protein [Rhizodiscina lignyota]|uniref:ENTH-domain-containing protein n=1 Tax=Rhizodiscina lignyota TaxID=1504668 RepID=A0A9P4I6M5_9PEZI|nr:ENTH-domain-containing protein [Rhizodiscina lignyota]
MDFSSLKDQVTNLTLYDLKAGVRKVQNAVMNYTEMEAKVREATNNEPWGASSTLMQEIANGTFSYQLLNEIMPMIYKRFTEKSAEEWRQIYKALQLLEFLIKNGSERVIDDARSHLSLLKMLRQFHFIDQNGKDQGINVRNRSKELTELLSDVERIRSERKRARSTRNKYGGVEGGMGMGGTSSRFGGFGSESGGFGGPEGGYGGYSGGVYGDGGGFGGNEGGFSDTQGRKDRFEEYDEYDEGAVAAPGRRQSDTRASAVKREAKKEDPPKPKAPEVDLFDFDEPAAPVSVSNGKAPATSAANDFGGFQSPGGADDDEFDDFQSATPSTQTAPVQSSASAFSIAPPASTSTTTASTQFAAPQPVQGTQKSNINDLFASVSPPPQSTGSTPMAMSASTFSPPPMSTGAASTPMMAAQPTKPTGYQPTGPNYFQSVSMGQSNTPGSSTPGSVLSPSGSIGGQKPKPAGGDAFSSLLGGSKKTTPKPGAGVSMADMAKQKTSASLWGAPAPTGGPAAPPAASGQKPAGGSAFDDLLG